jgi:hypothetical protein
VQVVALITARLSSSSVQIHVVTLIAARLSSSSIQVHVFAAIRLSDSSVQVHCRRHYKVSLDGGNLFVSGRL